MAASPVSRFAVVDGVSRVGDLLRLYTLPWFCYYALKGSATDRALFISICAALQSLPMLFAGPFAGRFLRRFSPLRASLWSNAGLGVLSAATAVAAGLGLVNVPIAILVSLLIGFMEVVYYPSRDCLYSELSSGDDAARARANRVSAGILHGGRGIISILMVGLCYLLGTLPDEMPRAALAAVFIFDAVTFGAVVLFLTAIPRGDSLATSEGETFTGSSFAESHKVPGVLPIVACTLLVFSFAYSGFTFCFCFYKELAGVGEYERQLSFYAVQFACAIGGVLGALCWRLSYGALVAGMIGICLVNATMAITPTDYVMGTVWLMANWLVAIFVHSALFEGIIPQLVQGLKRNAEVSALLSMVKEGISPFPVACLAALAQWLDAPRHVLFVASIFSLVACLFVLVCCRASIKDVIKSSMSERKA